MLFRNYSADVRFFRLLLPSLLRVALRAFLHMSWPTRLALLRINLRRWLVWLPFKIRERREGIKMPVTLQVIDDVACKAACANCLFTTFHDRKQRLSIGELDDLLDQALAMNITNVYLVGADPFYRDDIDEFLGMLARHRYQLFLLFTEGKRVTEAQLDQMRAAGNILPTLNIDGLEEASDRRKGDGTFAVVDTLLERMTARKMLFGATAMVSTANIDEVTGQPFVSYLDGHGAYFLAYIPYTPVDLRQERDLVLDATTRGSLFDRAAKLNRTIRRMVVFDLLGIEQQLTSCPAAVYTMTVYHDGTVTPCLAIPAGRKESNIRQRPLRAIFMEDPLYRTIRERHAEVRKSNRASGRRDKVHCLFYTDRELLRRYFDEHADEVNVLAPYAVEFLAEDEADEEAG